MLEARNAEHEGKVETLQDTFARNMELTKKIDVCKKEIANLEIEGSGYGSKNQKLKQEVNVCMAIGKTSATI